MGCLELNFFPPVSSGDLILFSISGGDGSSWLVDGCFLRSWGEYGLVFHLAEPGQMPCASAKGTKQQAARRAGTLQWDLRARNAMAVLTQGKIDLFDDPSRGW